MTTVVNMKRNFEKEPTFPKTRIGNKKSQLEKIQVSSNVN
jgi:hypothetical protein